MAPPRRKRIIEDSSDEEIEDVDFPASSSNSMRSSPPPPAALGLPPSSPTLPFDDDEQEIEEEEIPIIDEEELDEEDDAEDLIGDNMFDDYRQNRDQDRYDIDQIDDNEYEQMDPEERRKVDKLLNEKDRLQKQALAVDRDIYLGDGADMDVEIDTRTGLPVQSRRRRTAYDDDRLGNDDDELEDIDPLAEELTLESLADVKAESILQWILTPNVNRTIARELKSFLLEYTDENGRSVYGARIRALGEVNSESLDVSYTHILESKAILALFLASCPEQILQIFDVVAMEATELHYPDYAQIHSEVHVRITDFPNISNLRELRETHLNALVRVTGVVTRRTGVFPQLKYVKFDCLRCHMVLGPYIQDSTQEVKVSYCTNCQSRGPFKMNAERTLYRNYQRITLQEPPGAVPPGRLPRHREIVLLWDLVDAAKPGEEVDITGVYKNSYDGALNAHNGFPVFATVIEANCLRRRDASGSTNPALDSAGSVPWTDEDESQIVQLSKQKGIVDKIIGSMAPSIYGHRDIKAAIACSLFGGVPKDINGKHSIRGDINVLLLGDPGTAKSQILKYVEKTAHRAVFATGQGASAVGLTASVRKDPVTREWTLEGGALVLADKGTCLIDEFDKMNDQDRTSIHEAMEQQSISISKAGIVTSLQARCSIIAAANPVGGRYNPTMNLAHNVNLTEPILSRFDILCVVRDLVDPAVDERLAKFVVDSHIRSHPNDDASDSDNSEAEIEGDRTVSQVQHDVSVNKGKRERRQQLQREKENQISPIPQDLLVKYIHYARTKLYPKLTQMDRDKVARVYADLRTESITTGSFPITVRHFESILRIAESFARMRLSEFVSSSDLDRAIKLSIDSFVGTQKLSVRKQLQRSFMKYTLPK
ncbi:BA75_03085T0 [Komagataella pastoris]|uniref:DNA replication licensing factor MCM2 n=1 Tax=Komagataella pastoris TaxID=4922 RepID=A0A1B2JDP1_PICPA|nr:BA75_03085T0 [Komagataella pastoris]